MIITEKLLKQFIDVPKDIYDITNHKIIEIEDFGLVNDSTNLVIGKVLTCEDHPNSDHLHKTTVDLGDRIENIVCGAPNVAKGQYVIVAQVGSVLPGNFEIKKSKIRGEESNGMICSLQELGFDEKIIPDAYKEGIYYFPYEVKPGTPALEALSLDGWSMTLGLTPNRGDLLSVYGYALDLASVTGKTINEPTYNVKESNEVNPYTIDIESKGCGSYTARYIDQIKIKESPWWLKSALISRGMRPINNVVDISNYVLVLLGTPLHMFDANKIGSNKIVVRDAVDGEEVISLDEQKRKLTKDDVVITNGEKPIAIAGVMGLENTMVDDQTTAVLLEAAYFEPKRIQHTSKRLGLKSDSSLRFERGIDDKRVQLGLELATSLLVELADARVYQGVAKTVDHVLEDHPIKLSKSYISSRIGIALDEETLLKYFKQLNYQVEVNEDGYTVTPPSYRQDVVIDADVSEEIARLHGLNLVPIVQEQVRTQGYLTLKQKRTRMIRHFLADSGLNEIITYTLRSEADAQKYQNIGTPLSILMPLSEDKKVLRQSLLNGLLDTVKYNRSRQMDSIHLFEIGKVFSEGMERVHLGIVLHGTWHKQAWANKKVEPDFYLLKGLLEELVNRFGVELSYEATSEYDYLHPFRQAKVLYKGHCIGLIGTLHPKESKSLDINKAVLLEIDLTDILEAEKVIKYQAISKFPSITRDLAVVVDETLEVEKMEKLIVQTVRKQLVDLKVFDVYQGSNIETGMKSVAFNLVFNDPTKTLENEEVDKLMRKVMIRLDRELGAKVRS